MAVESLRVIHGGLLPEDQEREDMISELAVVISGTHERPLHERRIAFDQMAELIKQRPDYVVRLLEKARNLR